VSDLYRCEHGHAHYDGDQGAGSPYEDGRHHAAAGHGRDDGVADWEPWERVDYERGYLDGLKVRAVKEAMP
jgi:hypothetical protein